MAAKRPAHPTNEVGLCTGKDCRRSDGFRTVQRELGRSCELLELPCLDTCDGPVVVLEPRGDHAVVVERVRNRGLARELIAHAVDGEPLSARLRTRRLSGSQRSRARRRIARAV